MIDKQGNLHIKATRVKRPCEQCGGTNYPNLETILIGVHVVWCRTCLQAQVDAVNRALKETREEEKP